MKIEIDKPVIPQFIADWVEEQKEDCDDLVWENNSLYNIVDNLRHDLKMGFVNKRIREWLYSDIKNEIAFEKAILLGYEIEQPLYQVIFFKDEDRNWLTFLSKEGNFSQTIKQKNVDCLTEQEIKDIDERFWPFAERAEVE